MSSPQPRESGPPVPAPFAPAGALWRRVGETPPRWATGVLAGATAYLTAMRIGVGQVHIEQILICAPFALAFLGEGPRRFLHGVLPLLLFGVVYDLTHITQPLVRYLSVHVAEPYWFDRTFFGIHTAAGVVTPNEYFAMHNWPAVDFVTGCAYIVFVYWALGFGAWLAAFRRDEASRRLLARFGWTFLFMNIAGFATYYIYPAAPPWYVADYGLGPANMAAHSSAAGAARWDALTGWNYFAGFYGRSADVFGAIPSLHVAYPLLTFLHGRELRKRWLDLASFGLFATVCFAAIYLNHHYVLDVLIGIAYTLVAWGADLALERRRRRTTARSAAGVLCRG